VEQWNMPRLTRQTKPVAAFALSVAATRPLAGRGGGNVRVEMGGVERQYVGDNSKRRTAARAISIWAFSNCAALTKEAHR
jgi:hypothetical protein